MHMHLYQQLFKTLGAMLLPWVSVIIKKPTNILGLNIFIQEAAAHLWMWLDSPKYQEAA